MFETMNSLEKLKKAILQLGHKNKLSAIYAIISLIFLPIGFLVYKRSPIFANLVVIGEIVLVGLAIVVSLVYLSLLWRLWLKNELFLFFSTLNLTVFTFLVVLSVTGLVAYNWNPNFLFGRILVGFLFIYSAEMVGFIKNEPNAVLIKGINQKFRSLEKSEIKDIIVGENVVFKLKSGNDFYINNVKKSIEKNKTKFDQLLEKIQAP
ncbi:MAG: hypothetical protein DWQ02_15525 [Bacteroidetes bacterium]|nr:MAG: hypothetical protein DWQ02_15525 [Bacteroidota bacterium]